MSDQIYFAASTLGFYASGIHSAIPADAVPVEPEQYHLLMDGQSAGRVIAVDGQGHPVLTEPQSPDPEAVLVAWRAQATVSRFQARAALHAAGLLGAAEAAVAGADPIVRIAWTDAAEWRRDSPTIAAIAAAFDPPLTAEQVDDLFRSAALITA